MSLTTWVKRRWYRSLLPIAAGGLCFVALKRWPTEVLLHHDGLAIAYAMGTLSGILAAFLTVSVAVLCTMQMSAAVRAMLLLILWRLAVIARHEQSWVDWREDSALPESLLLIVGALVCELLRPGMSGKYLTGPRTRGLGVLNSFGDWILLASIIVYAFLLILSRSLISANEHLHQDFLLAGVFLVVGFAATLVTRCSLQVKRRWRFHVMAGGCSIGLFLLSILLLQSRSLVAMLPWPQLICFAVFAGSAWYVTQCGLCRCLLHFGWSWKRRRETLLLRANQEIDFVASDRRRHQIKTQGWTSFAGCVLLLAVLASVPDLLQNWQIAADQSFFGSVDLDQFKTAWAMTTRFVLAMAVIGVVAIVSVTVVDRVWRQILIAFVCWIGIGMDWNGLHFPDGAGDYRNELVWIAAAIPVILLTRLIKSLANRLSHYDVGPRVSEPRRFSIQSIMVLTLAVGVEIVLIQTIRWDVSLIVVLPLAGLLGILLTFFSIRRHLGKRTWVNLLGVSIPPVGLIVTVTAAALWFDESAVMGCLATVIWCGCFFGSIWLALGWLQHVGWGLQPQT
jgi:hypothetical protein